MYRSVDCATWDDTWFSDLEPVNKLLFLYLVTNRRQTPCGGFEIATKHIAFETGIAEAEIDARLASLAPKIVWWSEHRIVWVRNFYKHQHFRSNNENFLKGAKSALQNMPSDVCATVYQEYPELSDGTTPPNQPITNPLPTLDQPIPVRLKETETVKETETETEDSAPAGARERVADNRVEFEERCWRKYPRDAEGRQVGSKAKFVAQVRKLAVSVWDDFELAIDHYGASEKAKRGMVKTAEVWVRDGIWKTYVGEAQPLEVIANATANGTGRKPGYAEHNAAQLKRTWGFEPSEGT